MTINQALSILGLKKGSTPEEIKKGYRLLAKKYHPDIAGEQYTRKFSEINDAYNLLMTQGTVESCKLTHTSIFNVSRA